MEVRLLYDCPVRVVNIGSVSRRIAARANRFGKFVVFSDNLRAVRAAEKLFISLSDKALWVNPRAAVGYLGGEQTAPRAQTVLPPEASQANPVGRGRFGVRWTPALPERRLLWSFWKR